MLYTPAPGGKVVAKLLPREPTTSSRCLELWHIIHLSLRQRALLAKELGEVLQRYAAAELDLGAEAFLIHAAFAPKLS